MTERLFNIQLFTSQDEYECDSATREVQSLTREEVAAEIRRFDNQYAAFMRDLPPEAGGRLIALIEDASPRVHRDVGESPMLGLQVLRERAKDGVGYPSYQKEAPMEHTGEHRPEKYMAPPIVSAEEAAIVYKFDLGDRVRETYGQLRHGTVIEFGAASAIEWDVQPGEKLRHYSLAFNDNLEGYPRPVDQ